MNRSGEGRTRSDGEQTRSGRGRPKFKGIKDWIKSDANNDFRCKPKSSFLTLVLTAPTASTLT